MLSRFSDVVLISDHPQCTLYAGKNDQGSDIVVKVLKKKIFEWEVVLKLPEVDSLRRIAHPNVIKLLEVRKDEGDISLVFERAHENLGKLPDMGGRIEEIQDYARNILFQIANGVYYAHSKGIIHRDIRVANIYRIEVRWVLGGFKEAKYIRRKRGEASEDGKILPVLHTAEKGQLYLRSPELLLGLPYSYATDIFGLGVLFLELLTGKPPFDAITPIDQVSQIILMMGTEELKDWEIGWKKYQHLFGKSAIKTHVPKRISYYLPDSISQEALLLADWMLKLDPNNRATIVDVLNHPFFFESRDKKTQLIDTSEVLKPLIAPSPDQNSSAINKPPEIRPDSALSPLINLLGGSSS